jgi:hypothetical protein
MEKVGDEIAALYSHITAAMARWLALLAEFDEGVAGRTVVTRRVRTGCRGVAASTSAPRAITCAWRGG